MSAGGPIGGLGPRGLFRRGRGRAADTAPILQVIFLTIALTAVGTVVVLNVPWLPEQASSQASAMDTLYNALAVASVFIFALVLSILFVSVLRFRRRFGDESDGDPIHGHTGLEVIWTAIPAIIVTGAAIWSGVVLGNIEKPKPGTEIVNANGQQFAWTFDYQSRGIKNAGELHLVNDRNYQFKIHAKDVLHSFWVPEFRLKKDAVPGMTTEVRIKPTRPGTYSVVCAELCGLGHATMRARVQVESQSAFDRWAAAQKKAAGGAGGAP
jgi:cytochrome c oxidase subunit 2